jgi:dynein heavy chain
LLEAFLNPEYGFSLDDKPEKLKTYVSYAFLYAFVWSFGVSVYDDYHEKLSDIIRDQFPGFVYPSSATLYNFYFSPEELGFQEWDQRLKTMEFTFTRETPYWDLLVPTSDSVRYSEIAEWLIHTRKPVFMTGGSGVGKSVVLTNLLTKIQEPRQIDPIYLIFSAQTSSPVT